MARILVIGDPHFKVSDLKGAKMMADEIIRIARHERPDLIVNLGDTLDRFELSHTEPLAMATEWLGELSDIAPVKLIIGNHDRINNSDFLTGRHPFVALKRWGPRMEVIDKVVVTAVNGIPFFLVPYVPPGLFQQALETCPEWSKDHPWGAGFTHQEFYGIEVAKGIFSEKGDRWPLDGALLINGHIHDRSVPQENIISIGTPRQHDFDETTDKAVSLFSFTPVEGKVAFIETRIPLNMPKKIMLDLSCNDFYDYEVPDDLVDYLKINLIGNTAEINAVIGLAKIKELRARGIVITPRNTDRGKERRPANKNLSIKEWNAAGFRQRVQIRIKDNPDVERAYNRLFATMPRRVVIRRK